MSAKVQDWVYYIEEGQGATVIRVAVACLSFVAVLMLYNYLCFKNFNTEEAMDSAQLARNIAEGKGYTTDYIRLISLTMIQDQANKKLSEIQQNAEGQLSAEDITEQAKWKNMGLLRTAHPDLANPPVYPVLLAGLMKAVPMDFEISRKKPFSIYLPELWIALLNQCLFFLSILLLFRIALQLFDRAVAWITALLFGATELFWRFSVSGLSTMLAVLIFLCLIWSLLRFEKAPEKTSGGKLVFWGFLIGLLVGVGCLTRYSFGWLIAPVLVFLLFFGKEHKIKTAFVSLIAFLLVISPWLARNYSLSGNLFGTAGYAICENTPALQIDRLDRSLNAGSIYGKTGLADYSRKLISNCREIFQTEIPRLGGSWLTIFFIVGLFSPWPSKQVVGLRFFVVTSIIMLVFVQALGQGHEYFDSAQINSENQLVLISPLLFAFGVAFYFDLARRIVSLEPIFFQVVTLLFCVVLSLPLILAFLPPRVSPSAYPPYLPTSVQQGAKWMQESELMMSDVPWAVAWYGNHPCVSLTLNFSKDFFKLNDEIKPVQALYLTPRTTDSRLLTQIGKDPGSWGRFVLETLTRSQVPTGFPLKVAPPGFVPEQIFLTDWERWNASLKNLQRN